ncbi:hypothetical protein N177_2680 [Lutibaculum baratangense AMV1]|uniref:Sulfotransferase family protein n=1 Tax=Lutibaculum baratangense AMV1 TaxID=631454 RepID=V4RDI9_9HYPH|nr:hypothetical protein N177_2680 [Lutibaculum baratangense AMV1]
MYTFIPKNGCTTMRVSLAIANGCIRDPSEYAWVHQNNATFVASLRELVRAPFTFVILREPLRRLASVYLDKIVERREPFWHLNGLLHHPDRPDEMSFRRFVLAVLRPDILRADIHWRPQVDFLVYDEYDLWVPLERFATFVPEIEARAGLTVHDARDLTRHDNTRFEQVADRCYADASPHEIRAMRREGRTPDHLALYDAELRADVAETYAEDASLYRDRTGPNE